MNNDNRLDLYVELCNAVRKADELFQKYVQRLSQDKGMPIADAIELAEKQLAIDSLTKNIFHD